jgi:hypothetical protein
VRQSARGRLPRAGEELEQGVGDGGRLRTRQEVARLVGLLRQELHQGGRLFLLAYRRYGKSWLIHRTFRKLETEDVVITVYVDLWPGLAAGRRRASPGVDRAAHSRGARRSSQASALASSNRR